MLLLKEFKSKIKKTCVIGKVVFYSMAVYFIGPLSVMFGSM